LPRLFARGKVDAASRVSTGKAVALGRRNLQTKTIPGGHGNWILLKLGGTSSNRDAVAANVAACGCMETVAASNLVKHPRKRRGYEKVNFHPQSSTFVGAAQNLLTLPI
jgi:hypothetical protein